MLAGVGFGRLEEGPVERHDIAEVAVIADHAAEEPRHRLIPDTPERRDGVGEVADAGLADGFTLED